MTGAAPKYLFAVAAAAAVAVLAAAGGLDEASWEAHHIWPPQAHAQTSPFITTWRTTSANETITLPVSGTNMTISWGDGETSTGVTGSATHTYAAAGNHTVSVSGGLERFHVGSLSSSDDDKIVSLDQWGDAEWTTMDGAFYGASNMAYLATDAPDLSGVDSLHRMFRGATAFSGDLSGWDVSQVTAMSEMFSGASSFNGDISSWNVSKVTSMNTMFREATSFNGNISNWNVSAVANMASTFSGASSFNQDISGWNVSSVANMANMFSGASSFNGDISSWNVSKVTNMNTMFREATSFNGNISNWNVSAVTTMHRMFDSATSFNQPLNGWDVSSVGNMHRMFHSATSFDQNLGPWYVTLNSTAIPRAAIPGVVGEISAQNSVLDGHSPSYMIGTGGDSSRFAIASGDLLNMTSAGTKAAYMVNITASGGSVFEDGNNWRMLDVTVEREPTDPSWFVTTWRTASANETITLPVSGTNMTISWGDGQISTGITGSTTHTYADPGNHTVSVSGGLQRFHVGSLSSSDDDKIVSLDQWGDAEWTTMNEAFWGASNMIYRATDIPDLSGVTDMTEMFRAASSFDGNISSWDVSRVIDMPNMFLEATSFNQPLNSWNVSKVTTMTGMFSEATSFNQPLNGWDVSKVTIMSFMFNGAASFEQNLGNWYVTLNSTAIPRAAIPGVVGEISAQNDVLDGHSPSYMIGTGGDSSRFAIASGDLLNMTSAGTKAAYMVNITASGGSVFEDGNNWRMLDVTVEGDHTDPSWFVTTWRTASANETITLPVSGTNMTISWGDGQISTGVTGPATHTYAAAGSHRVSVSGGLERFNVGSLSPSDDDKLISLDQWGDASWTTMNQAFFGASNMTYRATDTPDLSGVTDMSNMFLRASSFNGDISAWNVSGITSMRNMFNVASSFNGNISGWDVSAVRDMFAMFADATSFNQPLDRWDVSRVTNMNVMFNGATSFEQNLGNWYVTLNNTSIPRSDIPGVVGEISAQNDVLDGHSPSYMIGTGGDSARFMIASGDLLNMTSADPARAVYTVNITASGGSVFEDGNNWRMVEVSVDDSFVTTWRTASPGETITLPVSGTGITIDWGDGQTSTGITGSTTHTYASPDDYTVSVSGGLQRIHVESLSSSDDDKIVSLDQWGDAEWTSMEGAFHGATNMIYRATDMPDLSGVTDMSSMFESATAFNGDISSWDVSRVTDMSQMFDGATSFNRPVGGWNVSRVTAMSGMFSDAASFNQPLNEWDVSQVTSMSFMFVAATSFNQPLNEWDVSAATYMNSMFDGAFAFDQNLAAWYVTLSSAEIARADVPGVVGTISAQNAFLDNQSPTYTIGTGGDSALFEIDGNDRLVMTSAPGNRTTYLVHVAAAGPDVFESGNNRRVLEVAVEGPPNQPPVVSVGGPQTVDERETVTVSGNATDPDQTGPLSYRWSQVSPDSPAITFADPASPTTTFVAPRVPTDTIFTIRLSASDGKASSSAAVQVTVRNVPGLNDPPDVEAGAEQTVNEGDSVTISGTATDVDGDPLTYSWDLATRGGPLVDLADPASPTTNFTAPRVAADTLLVFRLSVSDGEDTAHDTVGITVLNTMPNAAPAVDAGAAQTVTEGEKVTLSGNATDADPGDVLVYMWSQASPSSPAIALSNPASASTTFTAPQVGSTTDFTFRLIASDGEASSSATVVITVLDAPAAGPQPPPAPSNTPPTVEAGPYRTVDEGQAVTLSGSASDPDPAATLTYRWTQLSPPDPAASLSGSSSPSASFTAPQVNAETTFIFELAVSDGMATTTDTVSVTVRDVQPPSQTNRPPSVDAGSWQDVAEGVAVHLSGTASDPDGDGLTYRWSQADPPGSVPTITFSDPASLWTGFVAPYVDGTVSFTLRLTVSDGTTTASDVVIVTVSDAG